MLITYFQMDVVTEDGKVMAYTFEPTVENPSMEAISILEHEYYCEPLKAIYFRRVHRTIKEEK